MIQEENGSSTIFIRFKTENLAAFSRHARVVPSHLPLSLTHSSFLFSCTLRSIFHSAYTNEQTSNLLHHIHHNFHSINQGQSSTTIRSKNVFFVPSTIHQSRLNIAFIESQRRNTVSTTLETFVTFSLGHWSIRQAVIKSNQLSKRFCCSSASSLRYEKDFSAIYHSITTTKQFEDRSSTDEKRTYTSAVVVLFPQ